MNTNQSTFTFNGNNSTFHIGLKNINTEYGRFINTDKEYQKTKQPMYAAGLFVDQEQKVLLIEDNQDGKTQWKRIKIPGGVAKNELTDEWLVVTHERFLQVLESQLRKVKFSNGILHEIMDLEKSAKRTTAERTMILELIEETGYYPASFRFACDGYRFNRTNKQFDLWQVYFEVMAVVSAYSKSLSQPIKRISQVKTATAIDVDVTNMRIAVPINEVISKLTVPNARSPHQDAVQQMFTDKASYYWGKGNDILSKKFALASGQK